MGAPTIVHGAQAPAGPTPVIHGVPVGRARRVRGDRDGLAGHQDRIGPRPVTAALVVHHPGGRAPVSSIRFYLAAAVLVVAWLGVGREAYAGRLTTGRAWVILALWGLPLFLGPPLFSRDLYSYIGQGMIAHRGLDPYSVGPNVLGAGPLLSFASVWRSTASPYGPLFVVSTKGVVLLAGRSLVAEVLAFRALELVGVVLIMVSLPRLARHLGTDPGIALWLGALSPLALFGFVASGHNDALMVGLLVAGVTLWVEGASGPGWCSARWPPPSSFRPPPPWSSWCSICGRAAPPSRRWREVVVPVGAAIVAFVGVTLACGYGWEWLGPSALHVPTELRVLSTPLGGARNVLLPRAPRGRASVAQSPVSPSPRWRRWLPWPPSSGWPSLCATMTWCAHSVWPSSSSWWVARRSGRGTCCGGSSCSPPPRPSDRGSWPQWLVWPCSWWARAALLGSMGCGISWCRWPSSPG